MPRRVIPEAPAKMDVHAEQMCIEASWLLRCLEEDWVSPDMRKLIQVQINYMFDMLHKMSEKLKAGTGQRSFPTLSLDAILSEYLVTFHPGDADTVVSDAVLVAQTPIRRKGHVYISMRHFQQYAQDMGTDDDIEHHALVHFFRARGYRAAMLQFHPSKTAQREQATTRNYWIKD
jgi:hypothetical protein